jgi:hypothetical protein
VQFVLYDPTPVEKSSGLDNALLIEVTFGGVGMVLLVLGAVVFLIRFRHAKGNLERWQKSLPSVRVFAGYPSGGGDTDDDVGNFDVCKTMELYGTHEFEMAFDIEQNENEITRLYL